MGKNYLPEKILLLFRRYLSSSFLLKFVHRWVSTETTDVAFASWNIFCQTILGIGFTKSYQEFIPFIQFLQLFLHYRQRFHNGLNDKLYFPYKILGFIYSILPLLYFAYKSQALWHEKKPLYFKKIPSKTEICYFFNGNHSKAGNIQKCN